ncbi:hypothetical protein TNCT_244621 [Trichonephila clavata]|uniref:Uncharacterized protein n=1 Tax=Trichonephila clavata TaxID=2740835 RepID=A0A8X6KRQ7_TRICU|nr:hypothetical protein TNCT_244621 [Trichonephila clavata]
MGSKLLSSFNGPRLCSHEASMDNDPLTLLQRILRGLEVYSPLTLHTNFSKFIRCIFTTCSTTLSIVSIKHGIRLFERTRCFIKFIAKVLATWQHKEMKPIDYESDCIRRHDSHGRVHNANTESACRKIASGFGE